MKARGAVVVLALTVAALATGAVFMYVRQVEDGARAGPEMVEVIVASQDIPAGTDLGSLIPEGVFTTQRVPRDAVIEGAVTSLGQLQGKDAASAILAGEQIAEARIRGEEEFGGGVLGIPEGFEAVTVQLETSRVVGEVLRAGDHVTIYATFQNAGNFRADVRAEGDEERANVRGSVRGVPGMTVTLVPDVEVLKVTSPTGSGIGSGGQEPKLFVTLALTPEDAQRFVFATEQGTLRLALLPPGQEGVQTDPVTFLEVVR